MTERQLVQAVLAGNAAAERALYEQHVDRIYRLAYRMSGDDALAEVERRLILGTLQFCGGNRARAAKMLGIGIRTLYRKLRAYAPGRISGS